MASVNKVIIVGNTGRVPEIRYTQGGKAVASFGVATSDGKGDRERTEWHNVVVWDKLAEICGQYLTKGMQVYVEGRLTYRQWTDKEGHSRTSAEVVASQVVFLGNKGDRQTSPSQDVPVYGDDETPF